MRIVVTVGTHHQPFDRLVRLAADLAAAGHTVRLQRGPSRCAGPGCEVVDVLPHEALVAWIRAADVVITHAGPGTLFLAWEEGHRPVVVPRDPALGEHVDDHQLRFASRIADRALVLTDTAQVPAALKEHADVLRRGGAWDPGAQTSAFVAGFSALADRLVSAARRPPEARGTLREGGWRTGRR